MSVAFIFPGQGEQSKDMGIPVFDNFPETQRILDLVREVSGFDVYGISQEGDESILTDPEVSSVLVFSVSMAIQEVLAQRGIKPTAVAGYSVGQFSAMACAEVSDLTSMIQLVQERGKLLKKYAAASQSGMVGVIGLTAEKLEAALAGFDQAMIANYSTKTNLSVSCKREDIAGLMQAIEALEPIKVVELPVQGGWHSNFMKQAASDFLDVLEQHEFDQPKYDLYDNLTGSKLTDTDTIRQNLSQHLYEPVLWYPSINNMIQDGITTFVEVGHGLQLTKFTMLTNRRVKVFSTSDLQVLNKALGELRG